MRSGVRILVLEDNPLVAFDLQVLLEERGYSTTMAFTCEEAEDWLRRGTPDAAIINVLAKEKTCEDIAALLADRQVPFLVHTGYMGDRRDLHPVFENVPWFTKPGDYDAIVDCLRGLLGGSGAPAACAPP